MVLTLLAAVLCFVTVAGFGFVLVGGDSAQTRTLKRAQTIVGRGEAAEGGRGRRAQAGPDQRRRQILKTLKDQDRQAKKLRLTLSSRLQQAGLSGEVKGFWIASGVLGFVVAIGVIALGQSPIIALALGGAAAFGLPRWVVGFLGRRRTKAFTAAFPDAMDIVVRGIRSGLPVHDSLRVIGAETAEPLAGEFRRLVENLGMGLSVEQALERMHERMPTPEVRFFSIVLTIQQKTGGNLAEALGNLSGVIRARKLMREKIKAMSGEAVASAWIIGSLPPGVVALITAMSPEYMMVLFTDRRGQLMLLAGITWMSIGIFVMRKMINFRL
ncbi:type II secretion system F family protein [Phenylobacterium sp.]|uniref:type II secretion system F family protein n=1 Tax=Phenylobacterium sp. TaxID=1871053 RepID=UPI002734A7B6|nr:type II secretion system F family protein [Phenylobacterium sp.]MDP3660714.1 type II secretion system F family protein [Phenylobacterium sp.]